MFTGHGTDQRFVVTGSLTFIGLYVHFDAGCKQVINGSVRPTRRAIGWSERGKTDLVGPIEKNGGLIPVLFEIHIVIAKHDCVGSDEGGEVIP